MPKTPLTQSFLALVGVERSAVSAAQADFEQSLTKNKQLQEASSERRQEQRADALAKLKKRVTLLRRALGVSFLSMASAVMVGFMVWYLKLGIPTPAPFLAIASAFFFAWATLGRLGWGGQSWKGETSIEQLDQTLFHLLYWLGMYFATVASL